MSRHPGDGLVIDEPIGLRERKKHAMRATLSAIALRLAAERGVSQVRVEDIAAEAGVSPRTFNNYFPSKEAAIVGVTASRTQLFRDELRSRPPGEPLHEAMRHAVVALFPEEPDRAWVARSVLVRSEPALLAEERKSDIEVERALAEEIALRIGADARHDLYPRLVAAVVLAGWHTAIQYWLDGPSDITLRETLERTMNQLRIAPPES
jgi:AcrR family transcriptional regulator